MRQPGGGESGPERGKVVVVGSLNLDHTVMVERLPPPGGTVAGRDYMTAAGGKGLNQAVTAARQGAAVAMVGAVGDDAVGGLLTAVLDHEGIDYSAVRRVEGPSGTALVTVSDEGENTIVVAAGANGSLTPDDVERAELAGATVVLCQLETPLPAVAAALAAGRALGAVTLLNPAPVSGPLPPELLQLVDVIVPNETEAAALLPLESPGWRTGQTKRAGSAASARVAARSLVASGAGRAVVTLGRRGAVVATPTTVTEVPARVVDVVDPTAAGDAFIGTLAAVLAAGGSLEAAVERASAAGAVAVTRPGAVPSLPYREEVDLLLARDRQRL